MIIFCRNIFDVCSWRNRKNQALPNSRFCKKNLSSAEFTNNKREKPTLHSLTANHVFEMSFKLKFQCVRFEKKHCFALVVLNCSQDATGIIRFFC